MSNWSKELYLEMPRPITIGLYETNSINLPEHQPKHQKSFSQTHSYNFHKEEPQKTIPNISQKFAKYNNTDIFTIQSQRKSAQYYRSPVSKSPQRGFANIYNPYTRIKKVDEKILNHKKKEQEQFLPDRSVKRIKNNQLVPRKALKSFFIDKQRNKQIRENSVLESSEDVIELGGHLITLQQRFYEDQSLKNKLPAQTFTQNYKNRVRLTQRMQNRKNLILDNKIQSISPLRWKEKDLAKMVRIEGFGEQNKFWRNQISSWKKGEKNEQKHPEKKFIKYTEQIKKMKDRSNFPHFVSEQPQP